MEMASLFISTREHSIGITAMICSPVSRSPRKITPNAMGTRIPPNMLDTIRKE